MQTTKEQLDWLDAFPALLALEPGARELMAKSARIVEAPIGTIGYSEGMPCNAYVLRLAGQSRVYKMSSGGREILLYRVAAGETCVLTTTCLLGRSDYPASTVVEEPIRDVIIPAAAFNQLMIDSAVFRRFVMENYGALISDLIVLLDEVAFHSLDARLAKLLLGKPPAEAVCTQGLGDTGAWPYCSAPAQGAGADGTRAIGSSD